MNNLVWYSDTFVTNSLSLFLAYLYSFVDINRNSSVSFSVNKDAFYDQNVWEIFVCISLQFDPLATEWMFSGTVWVRHLLSCITAVRKLTVAKASSLFTLHSPLFGIGPSNGTSSLTFGKSSFTTYLPLTLCHVLPRISTFRVSLLLP